MGWDSVKGDTYATRCVEAVRFGSAKGGGVEVGGSKFFAGSICEELPPHQDDREFRKPPAVLF